MEKVCLMLASLYLQGTRASSAHISLARPPAWSHLNVREAGTNEVVSQQQLYTRTARTHVFDEELALTATAH